MHDRRVLLAAIVLLALVVRLAGIGDRVAEDEGFSWLVASAPDAATFLERLAAYENTPPLFYLLLTPLPLDDEHWLRLPSLVASVLSVPVLYLAVRPLLGTQAALLSALALAVAPYAVNWSNFSRGFMLANLGLLIALWAVGRLATGGERRWWWVYAGGAILAIYSEYDALLFLAALIGSLLVLAPRPRREIALYGALPLLALLPWLGELLRGLDALDETKAAPGFPPPSLAALRDSIPPLFLGEHGTFDVRGLRTVQFWLAGACLAAATAILDERGKRTAIWLLGCTGLGVLVLHAAASVIGPDIFAQRYLTILTPLGLALLAGGVALVPWRPALPIATVALVAMGVAVFAERHGRELEPDIEPVRELIARSGERHILTNSARVAFYLRDLEPQLDRPLGFGVDAEQACGSECAAPLAIIDDSRAPAGVRDGPGERHRFGPVEVRLLSQVSETQPVRLERGEMDPLTCTLAMLASSLLGGGPDARALPVTMQDDALLLHRTPAQVRGSTRRMASLGADRVRITAGWSALAPEPHSRKRPRFDARDSDAYPREPWQKLDRAVKAAVDAGLEVQLDVAFFAPRWGVRRGMGRARRDRQHWGVRPGRYAHFTEAVARRYSGTHADPADPRSTLPAVRLWTTWNEPNHPVFLLPQWKRRAGEWVPHSPHLYRRMHERAYSAIKRVSPKNQVLLGGLASGGSERRGRKRGMPPLEFIRELACVDRRGRSLTRPECRDFKPLRADGFAHHPYSLYTAPDVPTENRDHVAIADLDRLSRLLGDLHRHERIASRLPIFVTEYGYETNPPDITRGVSLEDQARYMGLSTYLAWREDDVASFAQFLLNDVGPPPGAQTGSVDESESWQSGLHFHDGTAKPAAQAFKLPFWAEARTIAAQNVVVLFGQVRPDEGRKHVLVEVQGADGIWRPVESLETRAAGDGPCGRDTEDFLTDSEGFYLRIAAYSGPATYRMRWMKANGRSEYGVPVTVGVPRPLGEPHG